MAKYERTRLCGCGECRFKPLSSGPCPKENSKSARWLWKTVYTHEEPPLDTPEVERETEEEVC